MKNKKENKINEILNENSITNFFHFIYKIFGKKLLQKKGFRKFFYEQIYNKKYEAILKKANFRLIPEEYFFVIFFLLFIMFIICFIISILFIFVKFNIAQLIFYTSILLIFIIGLFLYNLPIILANVRRNNINASLIYILPYLKILSKELNLQQIITLIPEFIIYKDAYIEFQRINYYYNFLGYDIHSSIRIAMESCPSKELSDILNDLVSISNSGGDIYKYLSNKLENLNTEIIAIEKKNIDSLLIFSQIYVVLLLIAPLFFAIMSSILELIQIDFSNVGGASLNSSSTSMIIFSLIFFLPLAYGVFIGLVYYTKPLYKRLEPIKNYKK